MPHFLHLWGGVAARTSKMANSNLGNMPLPGRQYLDTGSPKFKFEVSVLPTCNANTHLNQFNFFQPKNYSFKAFTKHINVLMKNYRTFMCFKSVLTPVLEFPDLAVKAFMCWYFSSKACALIFEQYRLHLDYWLHSFCFIRTFS